MFIDLKKLDNQRIKLGWTRTKLASLTGLSNSTISVIFREERPPRPDNLKLIAETLGLTMSDVCIEEVVSEKR